MGKRHSEETWTDFTGGIGVRSRVASMNTWLWPDRCSGAFDEEKKGRGG